MHYISIHKCNCYAYPDAFMKVFHIGTVHEMEPAEIRFILQVVIKEGVGEILEKSARPPCCERTFKLYAPSRTAAAWKQIANGAHRSLSSGLLSTTYSFLQRRYEKI